MDWVAIGGIAAVAAGVAAVVAAGGQIAAALIAAKALSGWRDQKRAELAERALADALRVQQAFGTVRSSMGWGSPPLKREQLPWEKPEDKNTIDSVFQVWEDFRTYSEDFIALERTRVELVARGEVESSKALSDLARCRHDIVVAGRLMLSAYQRWKQGSSPDTYTKRFEKFDELRWDIGEGDKINARIEAALTTLRNRAEESRDDGWGMWTLRIVQALKNLDRDIWSIRNPNRFPKDGQD